MKKIIFALSALALMIGMSSCQKEEFTSDSNDLIVTASIANGPATKVTHEWKTSPEGLKGEWKIDDQIFGLWYKSTGSKKGYKKVTFKCTDVEDDGFATFTYVSGDAQPSEGTTVTLVYAPGKTTSNISNNAITISLTGQTGKISEANPAMPMVAQGTVQDGKLHLEFKQTVAVVKLNLKKGNQGTTGSVRNVTFTKMKNQVEIDLTDATVSYSSSSKSTSYLNTGISFSNKSEITDTYVAVPAGEIESDCKIDIYNAQNTSKGIAPTKGGIGRTGSDPFVAGVCYEIGTAEEPLVIHFEN